MLEPNLQDRVEVDGKTRLPRKTTPRPPAALLPNEFEFLLLMPG
jgi:hypothetical protein